MDKIYDCSYRVAGVAVAGNVALTTANVDTGVLVGIAVLSALVGGDLVGRDRAAWDGSIKSGVLCGGKASKSRSGKEDGGVEHGGMCVQKISMPGWLQEAGVSQEITETSGAM